MPLFALLLAAATATSPAQSRQVAVQAAVPPRCVALYQGNVQGSHLLVSGETLDKLAHQQADGLPLDARMARIMGKRAQAVLAAAKVAKADAQGCQPVSLGPLHDAGYVVIPLVEAGRVAVWSQARHALVDTIRTRQDACSLDAPAGGFSATIDGEATPFFAMVTCVT